MSRHPLRRLSRYARESRWRVRAAYCCTVLNKLFDIAPPLLIGVAIDIVVEKDDSAIAGFGVPDLTDQLWVLAAATLIVWGLESVFESWPESVGEALHTQTFLGHPTSCAAALASLEVSAHEDLPGRARDLGATVLDRLLHLLGGTPNVRAIRGLGLMIGSSDPKNVTMMKVMPRSRWIFLSSTIMV